MSATYLMPTYNRQPISFTRGAGSWLYTQNDTPYLDALEPFLTGFSGTKSNSGSCTMSPNSSTTGRPFKFNKILC